MAKNKFPATKAGIIALAQAMINGLKMNQTDFPSPPVNDGALRTLFDEAVAKRNARILLDAAAKEGSDVEEAGFDNLTDAMKQDLKYAELVTNGNDAKLQELGWSGRAAPKTLQPPGAPSAFEVLEQGKGWAHFDWKNSKTGGKASMYKILMMEAGGTGDWKEAGSSVLPENTVTLQTSTGKDYVFTVVAVNSAGQSDQSNAITLFL